MARRRYQSGCLFKRGTRRKVWVARWREDVILADGSRGRLQRSIVLGLVSDMPTRRVAQVVLDERLATINGGRHRPKSVLSFVEFAKGPWMDLVFPTLKLTTQRSYRLVL